MTYFNYNFYPVGQGLFSSGHLAERSGGGFTFNWVYDCGTKSSKHLLAEGLDQMGRNIERGSGSERIDLLVLSHFDEDHINGVVDLMKRFKVHTLLLPYVPLHSRLELAMDQDVDPAGELMGFYLNPAEFINSNVADQRPQQILLMPPSSGVDQVVTDDGGADAADANAPIASIRAPENPDELGVTSDLGAGLKASILDPSKAIRVGNMWEFVPYNDASFAPDNPSFVSEVNELRAKLLSAVSDERKDALRELKQKYRELYPVGARSNSISIFLYAGPIMARSAHIDMFSGRIQSGGHRPDRHFYRHHRYCMGDPCCAHEERPGLLYSGDGFLNDAKRVAALCQVLGKDRVARTGCFQVMHHGSKCNWFDGVTDRIKPWMSVISADPKRGGHPHAEVLQAFWPYGATNVDKRNGAWVSGWVEY